MTTLSANAIRLLGDILEEQEDRLTDAVACIDDSNIESDLQALNELWLMYQSL
jgi:hypothetical protein